MNYSGHLKSENNNEKFLLDSKSIAHNRKLLSEIISYKSGDFITLGNYVQAAAPIICGFISGGRTTIYFTINTEKTLENIQNIEITELKLNIRTSDGKYLNSSGAYVSTGEDFLKSYKCEISKCDDKTIQIRIVSQNAFNTINNSLVIMEVNRLVLKLI